jgi:hypothetical protein
MNKKLEKAFANKGWLHESLIRMKRENEKSIASRNRIDAEMFAMMNKETIWTNKRINIKIEVEMECC